MSGLEPAALIGSVLTAGLGTVQTFAQSNAQARLANRNANLARRRSLLEAEAASREREHRLRHARATTRARAFAGGSGIGGSFQAIQRGLDSRFTEDQETADELLELRLSGIEVGRQRSLLDLADSNQRAALGLASTAFHRLPEFEEIDI